MSDFQVTLTPEERQYLVGLLERTLKEKRVEEHRTRTLSYREHLVAEDEMVQAMLVKLELPATAAATST